MAKSYTVHARWDEASRTWWTDGEEIPGLTCQGDTFDELAEVVLEIGPELLHANRVEPPGETVVITVSPPDGVAAGCGLSSGTPGKG